MCNFLCNCGNNVSGCLDSQTVPKPLLPAYPLGDSAFCQRVWDASLLGIDDKEMHSPRESQSLLKVI